MDDSNDNARSIDELAVIIANYRADAPEILTVKDDNGDKVLAIDEQGHFVVEQNSTENASGGELTPTGGDILRIKDDSGSVLVRVDSGGDVYMDGIIDDWVTCPLTPANDLLTIKNDTETPIAFFDDAGSLDLTGRSLVWDGGF